MDEASILEALQQACHAQSPLQQTRAMAFLHGLEGQVSLLPSLVKVAKNIDLSYSEDCRLLSIICLKNNVDRCWISRSASTSISVDNKSMLRQIVIEMIGESNTKISIQLAVLISRIARYDWPQEWPNLFLVLFEKIQSSNWMISTNSTQALLQVILTLQSRKLSRSKSQYTSIANEMLRPLCEIWDSVSTHFLSLNFCPVHADDLCEICAVGNHLCTLTRAMHIVIMQTLSSLRSDPLLFSLIQMISTRIKGYHDLLRVAGGSGQILFVFKQSDFISIAGDIWPSVSSWNDGSDPADFGLATCGPSLCGYGMDSVDLEASTAASMLTSSTAPLTLAASLTLSRALMYLAVIPYYMHRDSKTEDVESLVSPFLPLYFQLLRSQFETDSSSAACEPLAIIYTLFLSSSLNASVGLDVAGTTIGQFFLDSDTAGSPSRLSILLDMMLRRMMRVSNAMLEMWTTDPEELSACLRSASEGDNLRVASEGLYSALVYFAPDELCAVIVEIISDTERQRALSMAVAQGTANSNELLFWEAVYTCCGLSPYYISQRCQSSDWLLAAIGPMLSCLLSAQYDGPQLLTHRLLWLMSCWAHTLDPPTLAQVIGLISCFLSSETADVMVRLQSIFSIHAAIQVEMFRADMLLPVIETLLSGGCKLIVCDLSDSNSQISVINLFKDIVETVGPASAPYLPLLTTHMIALYESASPTSESHSSDENDEEGAAAVILRAELLDLLAAIVKAARSVENSVHIHNSLVPVVSHATSAAEDTSSLCKHGIMLWTSMVRNSSGLSPAMYALFRENIPRIIHSDALGSDYEEIVTFLQLLDGYMLLGGLELISHQGHPDTDPLLLALTKTIGQVKSRVVPYAIRPVESLLICPLLTQRDPRLPFEFLLNGKIFSIIIRASLAAFHILQDDGPIYEHVSEIFKDYRESDLATVCYLVPCARLILHAPAAMLAACGDFSTQLPPFRGEHVGGEVLMKGIIRLLMTQFDSLGHSMGGIWHRRMICLSLLSLYPTSDRDLVSWLPEVLYIVDDVLSEMHTEEGRQKLRDFPQAYMSSDHDVDRDTENISGWVEDDDTAGNIADGSTAPAPPIEEKEAIVSVFEHIVRTDSAFLTSPHDAVVNILHGMISLIGQGNVDTILRDVDAAVIHRLSTNKYEVDS